MKTITEEMIRIQFCNNEESNHYSRIQTALPSYWKSVNNHLFTPKMMVFEFFYWFLSIQSHRDLTSIGIRIYTLATGPEVNSDKF